MLEINHFTYGWVTPVIAYLMSVTGSLLALQCAFRARASDRPNGWLVAAAVALGGTGIWVMHFIAMLGFSIDEATIRYDVPITVISAFIAILVVWVGLRLVTRGQGRVLPLIAGGLITGVGVGAMHYAGMFAMHSDASITYSTGVVGVSLVIAIVAATAALWLMDRVRGRSATVAAALIMGVAVTGMHYMGMLAMHAHRMAVEIQPNGADAATLLLPLMIGVSAVTMVLLINIGLTDSNDIAALRMRNRRRFAEPDSPPTAAMGQPTTGGSYRV